MKRFFVNLIVLMVVLVACGGDDGNNDNSDNDETDSPTATVSTSENGSPTIDAEQRTMLEDQYELLRQSQTQIEEIWTDLRDGNEVSCAIELQFPPSPGDIIGTDPISLALFDAAVELEQSFGLWQAECDLARSQPPADVIDNGIRTALAAGDQLREAEALLSE